MCFVKCSLCLVPMPFSFVPFLLYVSGLPFSRGFADFRENEVSKSTKKKLIREKKSGPIYFLKRQLRLTQTASKLQPRADDRILHLVFALRCEISRDQTVAIVSWVKMPRSEFVRRHEAAFRDFYISLVGALVFDVSISVSCDYVSSCSVFLSGLSKSDMCLRVCQAFVLVFSLFLCCFNNMSGSSQCFFVYVQVVCVCVCVTKLAFFDRCNVLSKSLLCSSLSLSLSPCCVKAIASTLKMHSCMHANTLARARTHTHARL